MDLNWTTLTIFTLPQTLWAICLLISTVIVHSVFAWAVYKDADRFAGRRSTIFVGPEMWFLATLVGGVITAGIYWAMHHSRLNRTADEPPVETEENSQ